MSVLGGEADSIAQSEIFECDPSRKEGVHRNNHRIYRVSGNKVEKLVSQNLQRDATYRLAYSLSVDARQETDKLLLAFPA